MADQAGAQAIRKSLFDLSKLPCEATPPIFLLIPQQLRFKISLTEAPNQSVSLIAKFVDLTLHIHQLLRSLASVFLPVRHLMPPIPETNRALLLYRFSRPQKRFPASRSSTRSHPSRLLSSYTVEHMGNGFACRPIEIEIVDDRDRSLLSLGDQVALYRKNFIGPFEVSMGQSSGLADCAGLEASPELGFVENSHDHEYDDSLTRKYLEVDRSR